MNPVLSAGALVSLVLSSALPSPTPEMATPLPAQEESASSTAPAPDRTWLADQIQDRVERHRTQMEELTARALAAPVEQRLQIQVQMHEATTSMRWDVLHLKLDYARAAGFAELAVSIEASIARFVRVSETPETALAAEKAPRTPSHVPGQAAPVQRPAGGSSGLGERGGDR